MGLKHEAKKGTVIEISGPALITVLRGTAQLEIEAARETLIGVGRSQPPRQNGPLSGPIGPIQNIAASDRPGLMLNNSSITIDK
jgi:hypothetical protein